MGVCGCACLCLWLGVAVCDDMCLCVLVCPRCPCLAVFGFSVWGSVCLFVVVVHVCLWLSVGVRLFV